jgi:hypothetical protein
MSKSKKYYHPQHDWYTKNNLTPPTTIPHGTQEDLDQQVMKLKPTSWRLEGNKLIGETEVGPLVNFIPPNYILTGTDENGMPKLKKIDM